MTRRKDVITLRISPTMHAALRDRAHEERTSMNRLIEGGCAVLIAQSGPRGTSPLTPTLPIASEAVDPYWIATLALAGAMSRPPEPDESTFPGL